MTKSVNTISLAQYLEDKKLPSVAEINNSAKKEALDKKERIKSSIF